MCMYKHVYIYIYIYIYYMLTRGLPTVANEGLLSSMIYYSQVAVGHW